MFLVAQPSSNVHISHIFQWEININPLASYENWFINETMNINIRNTFWIEQNIFARIIYYIWLTICSYLIYSLYHKLLKTINIIVTNWTLSCKNSANFLQAIRYSSSFYKRKNNFVGTQLYVYSLELFLLDSRKIFPDLNFLSYKTNIITRIPRHRYTLTQSHTYTTKRKNWLME